jgi:hypothetical protein
MIPQSGPIVQPYFPFDCSRTKPPAEYELKMSRCCVGHVQPGSGGFMVTSGGTIGGADRYVAASRNIVDSESIETVEATSSGPLRPDSGTARATQVR